jgi:outer membrane protein TolC
MSALGTIFESGDTRASNRRYPLDAEDVPSLFAVEASASRTAALTQQRYRAGTSSVLDWLEVQRTRFSAEQDRVAGEAQLIKDYVALHKSLELRWQS